jgi:hypothetical protein
MVSIGVGASNGLTWCSHIYRHTPYAHQSAWKAELPPILEGGGGKGAGAGTVNGGVQLQL